MLPVSNVIDRIGYLLLDSNHIRFPVAELLLWSNEAMGAILTRKPGAFAQTVVTALVAGSKQTIPSGGASLMDVTRNIKADGVTPGRAIRRSDRQLLDDTDPDWHTSKAKSEIRNYTFDDRIPKTFYCYPPAIAGTKVELVHAVLPADVTTEAASLDIAPEYLEAVANYVAYRCNSKDSEYANPAAAMAFYQAFEAALGNKANSENMVSPNQAQNSV